MNGPHIARRAIHHVAFDVADIPQALTFFNATFGMGPFYRLINPRGDDPSHVGAAFASWGPIFVELIPMSDGIVAGGGGPRLNHVAYMSADPEAESARLAGLGLPKVREFKVGEVWPQFHDASSSIGCSIEIHQACADLDSFFSMVAASSEGWDGSDLERRVPAPGTSDFVRS